MSISKTYLKHEKSDTLQLKNQTEQNKNYNKIATLQPYLTDIEKKQKNKKSLLSNNKKNNQSSERSFRIKQLSTSSLYKITNQRQKSKQPSNTTIIPNYKLKIKVNETRQRKIKSYERSFQSSLSKTIVTQNQIQAKRKISIVSNDQIKNFETTKLTININKQEQKINFFNDHLLKIKAKENKNKNNQKQKHPHSKFRKDKYESLIPRKNSSLKTDDIDSLTKLSNTDVNIERKRNQLAKKQQNQMLGDVKKTEQVRKNNFRRGKYEALHSSVNQKPEMKPGEESLEPLHSERLYQMNKKQSNLSINEEMDILAENQMQKFYRQVRNKQIQKSLQKSTQKYFGNDSYRPVKSKNQIQLYVSSMHNPSLNKISQSTNDKSDNRTKSSLRNPTDLYAYNFDFEIERPNNKQKNVPNKIYEMQDPSEQESSLNNLTSNDFEKQRKQAEIQFFHKQNPKIDWSDDSCQIDHI